MSISMFCCWILLQGPRFGGNAKFPATAGETRLMVLLVTVGFLLAACLLVPMVRAIRFLDQRKTSRGMRGRHFVDRTAKLHPLALRGQDLRREDLSGACLVNTDLSDTDLRGADLSGADLENACLRGALYDGQTRWPAGFDPKRHGAVNVE
jgi:hypothetical protein